MNLNLGRILGCTVLGFTAATNAVAAFALYKLQHPPKGEDSSIPKNFELPAREVDIPSGDISLKGWVIPGRSVPLPNGLSYIPTVIHLHGFYASSFKNPATIPLMKFFHELGISSIAYDARAHGKSDGKISTIGLEKEPADLVNVYQWAKKEGLNPDILYGRSMGAATALQKAKELDVGLAILDSPYAGLDIVLRHDLKKFTNLPLSTLFAYEILAQTCLRGLKLKNNRPIDAAKQPGNPRMLIFHSQNDPNLPIRHSKDIYEAAKSNGNSARLLVTQSIGHSTNFKGHPLYYDPTPEKKAEFANYPLRYLRAIGQELMDKYGYPEEQIKAALAATLKNVSPLEIDFKPLTEKTREGVYSF